MFSRRASSTPRVISDEDRWMAVTDVGVRDMRRPIDADAACCCSAPPLFTVLLPAREGQSDPIDILLCTHHYRAAKKHLSEIAAAVYDANGFRIAL